MIHNICDIEKFSKSDWYQKKKKKLRHWKEILIPNGASGEYIMILVPFEASLR